MKKKINNPFITLLLFLSFNLFVQQPVLSQTDMYECRYEYGGEGCAHNGPCDPDVRFWHSTGPIRSEGFGPYRLIFYDEFEGTTVDNRKWYTYYPYGPHGPNSTDDCAYCRTHDVTLSNQVYLDRNVVVSNGTVKIHTKKENFTWQGVQRNFTSGVLYLSNAFRFKYGKFEIRCKVPRGKGEWPSFWLWGDNSEIDIFEFQNDTPWWSSHVQSDEYTFTAHKWCPDRAHCSIYLRSDAEDLYSDFHTYSVEWTPYEARFFRDGTEVGALRDKVSSTGNPFFPTNAILPSGLYERTKYISDDFMSIVAGSGIHKDNAPNNVHSIMEIDYIKVWQQEGRIQHNYFDVCKIIGKHTLCDAEISEYLAPETLAGTTWDVSPNLENLGPNITRNGIRVRPIPSSSGPAWVRANYVQPPPCGGAPGTQLKKDIWIGTPRVTNLEHLIIPCESNYRVRADVTPYPPLPTPALWRDNNPNPVVENETQSRWTNLLTNEEAINREYLGSDLYPGTFIPFRIDATNNCGTETHFYDVSNQTICDPYHYGRVSQATSNHQTNVVMSDNEAKKEPIKEIKKDIKLLPNILVYPNPASNVVRIKIDNISASDVNQVSIVSPNGNIIKRINIGFEDGIIYLDVSNYSNGTYGVFIDFNDKRKTLSKLFVVQH